MKKTALIDISYDLHQDKFRAIIDIYLPGFTPPTSQPETIPYLPQRKDMPRLHPTLVQQGTNLLGYQLTDLWGVPSIREDRLGYRHQPIALTNETVVDLEREVTKVIETIMETVGRVQAENDLLAKRLAQLPTNRTIEIKLLSAQVT